MQGKEEYLPQINSAPKTSSKSFSNTFVVGAKITQHFNVRCPGCGKLYRIDLREIHSSEPHFDCAACRVQFTFTCPPANVNRVETRVVSRSPMPADSLASEEAIKSETFRTCTRCGHKNPRLFTECEKCQVILAKAEEIAVDKNIGALPILAKAWHDLLEDYDNLKKHLAFVDRCEDLQALPYALKRYQALREAQPQDPVARDMFQSVFLKAFTKKRRAPQWVMQIKKQLAVVDWKRVSRISPYALSAILILWGLLDHSSRNLVGFGVSIVFVSLGLTLFLKGRVRIKDIFG